MQYFTFFSISEHIVFAFEVFPIAIVGVLVSVALTRWGAKAIVQQKEKLNSMPPVGFFGILLSLIAVTVTLLAFSVLIWNFGSLFMATSICGTLAYWIVHSPTVVRRATLATIILVIMSFTFGNQIALIETNRSTFVKFLLDHHLLPFQKLSTIIDTNDGKKLEARIIRSGDRGVLFYDSKNNQVRLIRWNEITQISSALPASLR